MTELLNDSRCDSVQNIDKLRKKSGIDSYRSAFSIKFGFYKGGWSLINGVKEVRPFESWEHDENPSPKWFKIYSKFKHDRYELQKIWTMKHTILMFIALTMLIQHWKKPPSWNPRPSKIIDGVVY